VLVVAGVSDLKTGAKLKTTDIARVASSSKVWIGAVVMQLIQEGRVSPSDKIAQYISRDEVKNIANAKTATIAQLLSHTSGIIDYYNDTDFGSDVPDKMDFTLEEALKYAWNQPAEFKPGARYSYSNSNTVLLAQMIETVTGQPFAKVLRSRIFTPLGLKHTFVEVFEPVPARIVRGYEFYSDGSTDEIGDKYQGGGLPDGALVTTPEDMALFMRALFADGKLLDRATLKQMTTPAAAVEDGQTVGYHIFITETDHGKRYEHDGAVVGYRAQEMYYPASGITIAIWTNTGDEQDETFSALEDDIVNLVFSSARN
jgi:D-alanyl-D-alanine carboxypeptidase